MKKQPDFEKIFYDYFQGIPQRRSYELRFGTSNLLHDVVILASLLHDSRFSLKNLKRNKNKITIKLERDMWESGTDPFFYINSELIVENVLKILWEFEGSVPEKSSFLEILDIKLQYKDDSYKEYSFILFGDDWSLQLNISTDCPCVKIQDISNPAPHIVK